MRRLAMTCGTILVLALVGCGSAPPGGGSSSSKTESSKDVLDQHHWLDDQGRVTYAEHAGDDEVQRAICSYLFGTTDHVAEQAGLAGTVALAKDSGYRSAGGGGIGFSCLYSSGSSKEPVFDIELWSQAGAPGKGQHLVQVSLHDGLHGATAYAPSYAGKTMSDATARAWLQDAASRAKGADH